MYTHERFVFVIYFIRDFIRIFLNFHHDTIKKKYLLSLKVVLLPEKGDSILSESPKFYDNMQFDIIFYFVSETRQTSKCLLSFPSVLNNLNRRKMQLKLSF